MDEKVKAKQDRLEEEERRRNKEKIYSEKVKNSENLIKTETLRKINKLRKQKSKTMKKRINKKKKQEINTKSNDFYEIPNLREVPLSCQDLVNKDDLVYVVPGDGACCPNSAAAFFFYDEVFGPKLRKKMNQFFVKHWRSKYQSLCPCSEETPFARMTRDGPISYTDPEEMFKFLLSDDDKASYMWSGCHCRHVPSKH